MSETEFHKWDLMEIITNMYRKDFGVEYGTPGRIEKKGPQISTIQIGDHRLSVENRHLRRPYPYRAAEYKARKKNTAAFLTLKPRYGGKSKKHNKSGLRRAYGHLVGKEITK